jgi:hypothetical protein
MTRVSILSEYRGREDTRKVHREIGEYSVGGKDTVTTTTTMC